MEPLHFVCPHCGAHLKTRDRLSIGRQVNCPECTQPFQINQTRDGLVTEKRTPQAPKATSTVPSAPKPRPVGVSNRSLVAAVGILGCVFLLVLALTARRFFVVPVAPPITSKPTPKMPEKEKKPKVAPAVKVVEAEQRLAALGKVLSPDLQAEKMLPAGTHPVKGLPPEEWFGWMAGIVDRFDDKAHIPVVRDRGWRDPLNEAFVRRRIPAFQNPAIPKLAGEDGYPAGHFAGMAGLGDEGPTVPASSPRAGAFAYNRRTRLEDFRDGLGSTMLVAGVAERLGSWASGHASVRSFKQEPFINGPDGFGTGEADRTFVLMADGRVVSLGNKTDPAVLRKMIVLADESGVAPQEIAKGPDDEPIEPVHEPDVIIPAELAVPRPPPVKSVKEIEASLQQAVVAYTFPPKTAVRIVVLREVAELTGVPLSADGDELGPLHKRLDEPLGTIPEPILKDTTVRGILTALLDPVGLTIRVEPGRLQLVKKPERGE